MPRRAHTQAAPALGAQPLRLPRTLPRQLSEADAETLDKTCRQLGVRLLLLRSYGLLGCVQCDAGAHACLPEAAVPVRGCGARCCCCKGLDPRPATAAGLLLLLLLLADVLPMPPPPPPPPPPHLPSRYVRPSVPEHPVIESKPDSKVDDLR